MTEDKATVYHRLRRRADLAGTAAAAGVLLTLIFTGGAVRLREIASNTGQVTPGFEELVTVAVAALLFFILLTLIELPLAFYQGYTLEHRYALSNQTARQWAADQAKGAVLGAVFISVGASIVYTLIAWNRDWWWLAAALVFAVLMIGLAQLAPVLLMPLFYRFKPLDRPSLVNRLMALANRARDAGRRRLRVGVERAYEEGQRGARRAWAARGGFFSPTRCSRITPRTRSRSCSRTSCRITCTTISGAAWRCRLRCS